MDSVIPLGSDGKVKAEQLSALDIRFAAALADGHTVKGAAEKVGMPMGRAHRLARNPAFMLYVAGERRRIADEAAKRTVTNETWVRRRLFEEATNFADGTAATRIRALELIARLNGDFEADNAQRSGNLLGGITSETLEYIRTRLADKYRTSRSFEH